MDEKILNKANKLFGTEFVSEIQSMEAHELQMLISRANRETLETKAELEANENYKKIKEDKGYLESGFREVRKSNNLKIALAHAILTERGVA